MDPVLAGEIFENDLIVAWKMRASELVAILSSPGCGIGESYTLYVIEQMLNIDKALKSNNQHTAALRDLERRKWR